MKSPNFHVKYSMMGESCVYSYDPDNQAQVYAVQKPLVFLTNKGTSDMPIDEHCCNPSDVLGSTNIKTVVTVSTPHHSHSHSLLASDWSLFYRNKIQVVVK